MMGYSPVLTELKKLNKLRWTLLERPTALMEGAVKALENELMETASMAKLTIFMVNRLLFLGRNGMNCNDYRWCWELLSCLRHHHRRCGSPIFQVERDPTRHRVRLTRLLPVMTESRLTNVAKSRRVAKSVPTMIRTLQRNIFTTSSQSTRYHFVRYKFTFKKCIFLVFFQSSCGYGR